MKKSHRKDVIIARVIFAAICLVLIAVIAAIIVHVHGAKSKEKDTQSQQTQMENQTPSTMNPDLPPVTENPETEEDMVQLLWTTSGVNMRTEPDKESTIITVLPVKTQVELIGEEEGWVKVLYNGQEGYISADYITDEDPAEAAVE